MTQKTIENLKFSDILMGNKRECWEETGEATLTEEKNYMGSTLSVWLK